MRNCSTWNLLRLLWIERKILIDNNKFQKEMNLIYQKGLSCCQGATNGPSVSMQLANSILKPPRFRNMGGLHTRAMDRRRKEEEGDGEWWMTWYHVDLHATAGLLHAIFGIWKATFSGTWMGPQRIQLLSSSSMHAHILTTAHYRLNILLLPSLHFT